MISGLTEPQISVEQTPKTRADLNSLVCVSFFSLNTLDRPPSNSDRQERQRDVDGEI